MATQQSSQEGQSQPIDIGESQIFDYEELQEATKFFNPSQRVGEGAFGVVYRGDLTDGRAVAIKELIVRDKKSIAQFFNEACLLSRLRHDNLVTLYGCTNPVEEKMLLVYEFVHNGALANHLHDKSFSKAALTWSQRLHIATQTADALAYLHSLQPAIIHRDVKTDNILLDKNFNVKVADFGLCRLLPPSGAHVSTMAQGTQGYLAPESLQFGKITTKSDVYSFGVVLMELISSKAVLDYEERDGDEVWLVNLAFNKMKNDQLEQLVDLELGYLEDPKIFGMVNNVARLASKCLESIGYRRPLMVEVLKALRKISDVTDVGDMFDYYELLEATKFFNPSEIISDVTDVGDMFDYSELLEATKFFNPSEIIGHGSFGVVYRGKLRDGRAVAIRELFVYDNMSTEQFLNEARLLSRIWHKNLVRLYGCTDLQGQKMLLVYEFVPNGTVADHLHHRRFSKKAFTWSQRLQIAIQTAEGIAYLHSLQPPVIHRDIRTDNILLDYNFNVKVADFGMLRSLPPSVTHISTMPEYNQLYKPTTKSDVYSFGVVLWELISGKAVGIHEERDGDEVWLVNTAKMRNHPLKQPVDPELGYLEDPKIFSMVNSVAELAYECLNDTDHTRPPMVKVLKSLKEINDDGASNSSGGYDNADAQAF